MNISINTDELMFDIKNRSHNEVANIVDTEARYRAEAGTEKDELLKRCILTANSKVRGLCNRFICDIVTENTTNGGDVPVRFVYVLEGGERRLAGKGQDIANLLHEMIVNLSLANFYSSVTQPDLANMHTQLATQVVGDLSSLLYEKRQPYPLTHTHKEIKVM